MGNLLMLECNLREAFDNILSDFSVDTIMNFTGLIGTQNEFAPKYTGDFHKLVFAYGDEAETYTNNEITIINNIDAVIQCRSFNKTSRKGGVSCSTYIIDIKAEIEIEKNCIATMKIINKAFKNYNIYIFRTKNGIYFGSTIYGSDENKDCILSGIIGVDLNLEDVCDQLNYAFDIDDFTDFYLNVIDVFYFGGVVDDYDQQIAKRKGVSRNYLECLYDISKKYHIDLSALSRRYLESFDDDHTEIKKDHIIDDIFEELKYIKSSILNSFEMLLTAEEFASIALGSETTNDEYIKDEPSDEIIIDERTKELLKRPEEMIKQLKKAKGL